MQYASLLAFLDGDLSPSRFRDEIDAEVTACTASLKSTGHGSISMTKGPETTLTRVRARRLLQAVADQVLSSEAASYVADCIIMGDTLETEDDLILEALHFLADGDYWPLAEEDVRRHLDSLAEDCALNHDLEVISRKLRG